MSELKELILIRHGEAVHHVEGLTGGWTDSDLTDVGRDQANAIARLLAKDGVGSSSRLLSSDLRRARQITAAISQATGLKAEHYQELREPERVTDGAPLEGGVAVR